MPQKDDPYAPPSAPFRHKWVRGDHCPHCGVALRPRALKPVYRGFQCKHCRCRLKWRFMGLIATPIQLALLVYILNVIVIAMVFTATIPYYLALASAVALIALGYWLASTLIKWLLIRFCRIRHVEQ